MEKQYSIEDGKALIEKYLKSGMSGAKFCKQNGISYFKMVYWRKILGHGRKHKPTLTQTKQTESEWAKLEMNPKSQKFSTASNKKHGGRTGSAPNYSYTASKVESYTYYADGLLHTKTDRNGNTFTYTDGIA